MFPSRVWASKVVVALMMPKINVKPLMILLGALLILCLSIFGIHEFQMSRNSLAYIREAKRAQADGRLGAAASHLLRYTLLKPNDVNGLVQFGMLLAEIGKTYPEQQAAAYVTLQKVIGLDPGNVEVRRKLAELASQNGLFAEAIDNINYLLKEFPDDIELLDLLSDCHVLRGDYNEAESMLESTIAKAPERLSLYIKLANLRQTKLNRPGDAVLPVNQMVAANSENPLAYFNRSEWLLERLNELKSQAKLNREKVQDYAVEILRQADEDAQEALKLAPDNIEMIVLAIRIAYEQHRKDELRALAQKGVEQHPKDSRCYLALAELEKSESSNVAAINILNQGVATVPDNSKLRWSLTDVLIDHGDYPKAKSQIAAMLKSDLPVVLVQYLEAKMSIFNRDWLVGIRQLEALRQGLRDHSDLMKHVELWLGFAYRETKSFDQQLICFRRSVALDPSFLPSRFALAETLMNGSLLPEAISEFEQIYSDPNSPASASIGLARCILLWNLDNPARLHRWDNFERALSRLEQTEQPPAIWSQIAVLRMERLLSASKRDEAEKIISAAREQFPDQIELWTAQIGLAQVARDTERCDELFQDALLRFGDTVSLRELKGRYLVQQQGVKAAGELVKLSTDNPSWTGPDRAKLAGALATQFLAVGDLENAAKQGLIASQAEPANLSIRLVLLDVAVAAKRVELMQKVLDECRKIAGEGAIWHFGTALLLTQIQEADEPALLDALSHLKKARVLAQSWGRVPLLMASLYERRGDQKSAIEQFIDAIRLGERGPSVTSHALALLFNARRFEDAENLIKQLREAQSTFTSEMAQTEVDIALQLGRVDAAIKATEQLVRSSQNVVDPVWLGRVYGSLGKYVEAEAQFRRAIQLDGKKSIAWINLVKVLTLAKQPDAAMQVIEEAKGAIEEERSILAIAFCYELAGKNDLALATYRTAFEKSPDDVTTGLRLVDFLLKAGISQEAEVVLRKLVKSNSGDEEISQDQRRLVHRKLANLLINAGSQEQLNEALALVERNLGNNRSVAAEDLRLKAIILANGQATLQHEQAVAILERLVQSAPANGPLADDQFLLARLYLQAGDRVNARIQLRKLIGSNKSEGRFILAYAQLCLQSNEPTEAELYLSFLQKLAPYELSTIDLEAQVLFAKGRYSEISTLLKGLNSSRFQDSTKLDAAVAARLWAAKRLEEFSRRLEKMGETTDAAALSRDAEELYTRYVKDRPEEMLVFAEFLGKENQVDRALDLLQEHGPKAKIFRVAGVVFGIMKNTYTTPDQLARLQELLKSLSSSFDNTTVFEILSADLLSWRGSYPEANAAYKGILRKDERDIRVLNNLAVLLALTGEDYQEAERLLKKAIEIAGPLDALLDSSGVIKLASGHPETAIVDFEKALQQRESAERRFHAAAAYTQLKRCDAARKSLDRADKLQLSEQELHPLERPTLKSIRAELQEQQ